MSAAEKLAAILAAVQTDPGGRGLAKVPGDNLFTACRDDFAAACDSIVYLVRPVVTILTGFFIPSAVPPAFETDGPLGAAFLVQALNLLGIDANVTAEGPVVRTILVGLRYAGLSPNWESHPKATHLVAIERPGPGADGVCRTMRGIDLTDHMQPLHRLMAKRPPRTHTIGIGDGGNEIGMGKIPNDTVARNIRNGDTIHCRIPTDHLIVAGVSNWGAYALAAGVYVLRGVRPPAGLFDPDREREILEVMVREGPLVDGVTGEQTATVDGLPWDVYAAPLARIRDILEA